VRVFAYGRLGDGNLHYNVVPPADAPAETASLVRRLVHDAVADQGGSISAEHGVGQLKRDELPRYRLALELRLMRTLKQALDPRGVMNPGKVLPLDAEVI
jgi:FAD/FMN-containing dehydrogenase